jgi:type I restriction enzyme, S subunit
MKTMNPDVLLRHFDEISEAPDAISRLRRFILDLAVRGKLVPQDPNDEPASELLKRVEGHRSNDSNGVKFRRAKESLPVGEVAFALPQNWKWTRLAELGYTQTGTTPSKANHNFFGEYIPFIKPNDLFPSHVDYENEGLSESGLAETGRLAPAGSLLMVCIGTIGKCQVIDRDCSFNQQINSLTPAEGMVSRYVFYAVNCSFFQDMAMSSSSRTTIAILNKRRWEQLPFPLPPLAEQHRIVAKVDELMAICDELEVAKEKREKRRDRLVAATLHGLNNGTNGEDFHDTARFYFNHLPRLTTRPEHIQQLRQTILNLAVRGKLVPQDPNDEPAYHLLNKIEIERQELIKKGVIKQKEIISKKNEPRVDLQIPKDWKWVELQDIFLMITDGDHQPPPRAEHGIPFLVIGNVRDRRIDLGAELRFVPEDYYLGLDEPKLPRQGKILYTLVGSYGIPILLTDDLQFCVQRHIGILTPSKYLSGKYLVLMLDSGFVRDQATKCATGIAQKTVPLLGLRRILMPLPPLAEQHRIVAKVDELMAICDELEARLTTTSTTRRQLLESTLKEVLFPQDQPQKAA